MSVHTSSPRRGATPPATPHRARLAPSALPGAAVRVRRTSRHLTCANTKHAPRRLEAGSERTAARLPSGGVIHARLDGCPGAPTGCTHLYHGRMAVYTQIVLRPSRCFRLLEAACEEEPAHRTSAVRGPPPEVTMDWSSLIVRRPAPQSAMLLVLYALLALLQTCRPIAQRPCGSCLRAIGPAQHLLGRWRCAPRHEHIQLRT
jgi:hypothetical protein